MKTHFTTGLLLALLTTFSEKCISQIKQDTSIQKLWSLEQCIAYAKEHNIQVNVLQLNEKAAAQNVIAAKGNKIPSLSSSVGNTFLNANNNPYGTGNLVNQLSSNGTYSLNSSLVLWNDHSINNTIRLQALAEESAGLTVKQTQNSITLSITQAYLNILLARENEKYVSELYHNTDSILVQTQQLFEEGSIPKTSLLQVQSQLASDKYLLVQAQNNVRLNTLSLKQLMQLPSESSFEVAEVSNLNTISSLPSLQEAQQTALQNFPEIKNGQLGVEIGRLTIEQAKAAFKPVIRASGALSTGYSDVLTNAVNPKINYFKQTGNNFYQSVGVTASIPIFAQRQNKANFEKAKIAYSQANLSLENNKLVLTQAVEQAYLNARNAQQAYEAAKLQLVAATESYRIVNAELKVGALNAYDLLQQRNQYVQAVQSFTQAKYTAILQQKIYQFYLGSPITL